MQSAWPPLQRYFIRLTHVLLKGSKINEIVYLILKTIEMLQLIHFPLRIIRSNAVWDSQFIHYFDQALSFISIDSLIEMLPSAFFALLLVAVGLLLLNLVLLSIIGFQADSGTDQSWLTSAAATVTTYFLIFNSTVLQTPYLMTICLSMNTSALAFFNVPLSQALSLLLGGICIVLYLIVQVFLVTSYKEMNPFSEAYHLSESSGKFIVNGVYKLAICLFVSLDYQGKSRRELIVAYTIINSLVLIFLFLEGRRTAKKIRLIAIRLQACSATFGLCLSVSGYAQNRQWASLAYAYFLLPVVFFLCGYIDKLLEMRLLETPLLDLVKDSQFVDHILVLSQYIDQLDNRQYRSVVEGYLRYHHHHCSKREAVECKCNQLVGHDSQQLTKQHYFKLAVDLLKESLNRFKDSAQIHLLLNFIYQHRLSNRFQAIYSLVRSGIADNYTGSVTYFHQNKIIEKEITENELSTSQGNSAEVNRFFEFSNRMVEFETSLEEACTSHVDFWLEILEPSIEIKRFQELGTAVTDLKEDLKQQFDSMMSINSNSIHILLLYGRFLAEVAGEQAATVKYLEKAGLIHKNMRESSKLDGHSKYDENATTCVVIISGNEQDLGSVVHTNNFLFSLLRFQRSELIGRNISGVMPGVYGQTHNQVLSRYLACSTQRFNNRERIVPALTKDGFIIPCWALTKAMPDLKDGIRLVGFLSRMEEKCEQDQGQRAYSYILFRADTQQVLQISESFSHNYAVAIELVNVKANSLDKLLNLRQIFATNGPQKIFAAIEDGGEVQVALNTTRLNNSTFQSSIQDRCMRGLRARTNARLVLSQVYGQVPLRLVSLNNIDRPFEDNPTSNVTPLLLNQEKMQNISAQETETEETKDYRNFKNFISLKSKPNAISCISIACTLLLCSIIGGVTLILVGSEYMKAFTSICLEERTTLSFSQIAIEQISSQLSLLSHGLLEKQKLPNFQKLLQSVAARRSTLFSIEEANADNWIMMDAPFSLRPLDQKKPAEITNLSVNVIWAELVSLAGTAWIDTNITKAVSVQTVVENTLYSLVPSVEEQVKAILGCFNTQIGKLQLGLIITCSIVVFVILTWLLLVVPNVLSIKKINSRVLSLFGLIPKPEVVIMIRKISAYVEHYLIEAGDSVAGFQPPVLYLQQDNNDPQASSAQLNLKSHNSSISMLRTARSSQNQFLYSQPLSPKDTDLRLVGPLSVRTEVRPSLAPAQVESKFKTLANSDSTDRQAVFIQFSLLSLLGSAFIISILGMSMLHIKGLSSTMDELFLLELRTGQLRLLRLASIRAMLEPTLVSPFDKRTTAKQYLEASISNSYNVQRSLLSVSKLSLSNGIEGSLNTDNICDFLQQISKTIVLPSPIPFQISQCGLVLEGTLKKGLKSTLVARFEELRSLVLLAKATPNMKNIINRHEIITRYCEAALSYISVNQQQSLSQLNRRYQGILMGIGLGGIVILLLGWRLSWQRYTDQLSHKIWRTKGMLNIIPLKIILNNETLKKQFTSGQLEEAVR